MLVIGHRGASAYAPEHTFASWDLALAMGADYLEQDLQMTRDGVLVVMHDETLDRTTRGAACAGRVIDHTFSELQASDVGAWFNDAHPDRARPEFVGQHIPSLDEVFGRYSAHASFYVETKKPEDAPGMEEALLELLDRHSLREPAATEWRVLIQSFSEASLRRIHALDPSLPLIRLVEADWATPSTLDTRLAAVADYAVGVGPAWRGVDHAFMAAARRHCLDVHPYTVNDPETMRRLAEIGVTGMFTDAPDVLLASRPTGEARGRTATAAAAARHRQCRARTRP